MRRVGRLGACRRRHSKGSNRRSGGRSSGKYDGFQRPAQGLTTVAFLRLRAIGGTSRAHAVAPLCATTLRDAVVVPHGQGAGCCVFTSAVDEKTVLSQLQSDVVLLVSCVKSDVK